jgi:glycosyltransferase involved in cell wall biosynthesis
MPPRYVLLTAAKNEADYIEETLQSVLRQTLLPAAWYIIDDGSTDQTAAIVKRYASTHPFIHLHSAASRGGRNFGSQYKALQAAYELAEPMAFEFVGAMDADISPQRSDYYETILGEFEKNAQVGICGGYIYERANGDWQSRPGNSEDSVAGGIQMFRRKCFEEIGGYVPLYYGGSDSLAQLEAQMAGWQVRVRTDQPVFHYRPTSTAGGRWRGLFRSGLEDASFGSHPIFEFFRCCRRIKNSPFLFGSAVRLGGFIWWNMTGRAPVIPKDKVAFLRKAQVSKLRRWASSFRAWSVAS